MQPIVNFDSFWFFFDLLAECRFDFGFSADFVVKLRPIYLVPACVPCRSTSILIDGKLLLKLNFVQFQNFITT